MAEAVGPSIIFVDEAEMLFASKDDASGRNATGGNLVNLLLDFMNNKKRNVILIIATNYPWIIDRNFRRRFPKKMLIGKPTVDNIAMMLKEKLKNLLTLITDDQYKTVAKKLTDFTPSDVDYLVNLVMEFKIAEVANSKFITKSPFVDGYYMPCRQYTTGAKRWYSQTANTMNVRPSPILAIHIVRLVKDVQKTVTEKDLNHHLWYSQNPDYRPPSKEEEQRQGPPKCPGDSHKA